MVGVCIVFDENCKWGFSIFESSREFVDNGVVIGDDREFYFRCECM